jgi:hypothetical protein
MAQQLRFEIGSSFSGEGFKQAQKSVGDMNNSVKSAVANTSNLAAAFGGLDTSFGKAMRAATGMLDALVSLNAAAILTQGAMLAISAYVDKCNKEMERLKTSADNLKASVDKAFSRSMAESVADVNAQIKNISGGFERVTAQASAFAAAMSGLKGSVATGGIINLEIEKVNKMLEAHSAAEKSAVEATYNLKIATEKAAASREQWKDKIEAAHAAVVANQERIANADKELAAVQAKRTSLETLRANLVANGSDQVAKVDATLATLAAKEEAVRNRQLDLRSKTDTLVVMEQKAIQDAANAEQESTLAINKATAKINDLEAAQTAAQEALEKERQAREAHAAQLKAEKEVQEDAADAQRKVNDAAKDVAAAERAYAKALSDYERNFADNKISENIFGQNKGKGNLSVPVKIDGTVKAQIVSHDLQKAINDGLVRSVKDMDKFNRERAKQLDKEEREKWLELKKEKQKYDQLMDRNRKTWSQQDRDFVQKFEKLRDTALEHKKQLEDAKQNLQIARQREKDNHENLKNIKEKLNKLGLK